MQLSDYYHTLNDLVFSLERKTIADPKFGKFLYIPQGYDVFPHHTLVFSKFRIEPSKIELEAINEALSLVLRQFTRKHGHVLIQEIEIGPCEVSIYTCYVTFTWTTATVADFGRLSKPEEAVSAWWLREVSKQQEADKQLLARIQTPVKRTWQQPSILPE